MITGIYVFTRTTLTFTTSETVVLNSLDQRTITATASDPAKPEVLQADVAPGVYKVSTVTSINVTPDKCIAMFECPSVECQSIKDLPPSPPPLQAQDLYKDQTQLSTFFSQLQLSADFPTSA